MTHLLRCRPVAPLLGVVSAGGWLSDAAAKYSSTAQDADPWIFPETCAPFESDALLDLRVLNEEIERFRTTIQQRGGCHGNQFWSKTLADD
jgi:hypothetical protein